MRRIESGHLLFLARPLMVLLIISIMLVPLTGCGKRQSGNNDSPGTVQTTKEGKKSPSGPQEEGADIGSDKTEIKAAVDAALDYASKMNPEMSGSKVVKATVESGWAMVSIEPPAGKADNADALLKYESGSWNVVDFGFIVPQEHPEAPSVLFQ